MIIDIPKQNNFNQRNDGDIRGSIWASKNIDPEFNPGKIHIGKAGGFNARTATDANLGKAASGFLYTDQFTTNRYFAVADDRVWVSANDDPDSGWSEAANTPTDCDINSDIIEFHSKVYVATTNNLVSFSGGDGSTVANVDSLSSSPHSMTVYANRLYVSDLSEKVYSMNTSEVVSKTGSNTIDLNATTGEGQSITKIAAVSNGIWIATVYNNKAGGEMVFWDGATENTASARYQVPRGVLAMVIKDDRPYVMDSGGRVRVFDGTTFAEISRLPLTDEELDNFNNGDNDRWIHPNGMTLFRDEIYFLISNRRQDTNTAVVENLPSGVWAWNPEFGLYHKYSFSSTAFSGSSWTQTDYGSSEVVQVGALYNSQASGSGAITIDDRSELLAGVEGYTDATSTSAGFGIIDTDNDVKKAGYFVTSQIQSEQVDELWQEVVAIYDKMDNATDKIVVKYRTSADDPVYATGTWSSDTILRSTDDLSTVEDGDEVEILRGTGSGLCAHIDSITGNYRIQLDENSLSGMTGTCRFRVQKWKKIDSVQDTVGYFKRMAVGKNGAWIQFKVYMEGVGDSPQLNRFISISTPNERY